MRSFLASFWSTAALLSAGLVSATVADEIAVHLPEDASAGQAVVDLRELLQLAPTERVRLGQEHRNVFRIDTRERLVVAPRARLDHESQPEHRIILRIVSNPSGRTEDDLLESRFSELLTERQGTASNEDAAEAGRTATVRILVDNVPEPPLLLGSSFRIPSDGTPRAGQRIGRAIVIDPDHREQHHFELAGGDAYLRIDPGTGELYLREGVDPLSVATLRAVVRVTDRAGLSAQACYPVRLNESPPAPPLPVLLAEVEDRPSAEDNAQVETASSPTPTAGAAAASISATPSQPRTPGDGTETAASTGAAPLTRSHSEAAGRALPLPVFPSGSAQSGGPAWLSGIRELLSSFGLGGFDEHRTEWLIVVAAVTCVVVIVIGGVRNVVLAGREPGEAPSDPQATSSRQHETPPQVAQRDPQEVSQILERLDAVIAKSEHAADSLDTGRDSDADPESAEPAVAAAAGTDVETDGRMPPGAARRTPDGKREKSAAAAATPAVQSAPERAAEAAEEPAVVVFTSPPWRRSDAMTDEERQRMEQFREISRMMNRADIGRHSRERMRDEWMSVGVTSLACVVTGTVCVFTSCFGTMSVPICSVMFSVAAALLMRPSLYLQFPPHDAALSQSGERVEQGVR